MSCAHSGSRSGSAAHSSSSSPTSSACRPRARSAVTRPSSASCRSSSKRTAAARANGSSKSASAGPRHRVRAARSTSAASATSDRARCPTTQRRERLEAADIQLIGPDPQEVAGLPRLQPIAAAKGAPHLRDIGLQRRGGARGRTPAHSSSARRSAPTTALACRARSASNARGLRAGSASTRAPSATSRVPSSRNSTDHLPSPDRNSILGNAAAVARLWRLSSGSRAAARNVGPAPRTLRPDRQGRSPWPRSARPTDSTARPS